MKGFWTKEKVIEGKDGMLFLTNDTNDVMAQITGKLAASASTLASWHQPHAERHAICASRGASYRHVICPNKESIEVKRLPNAFKFEQHGPTLLRQYIDACPVERPFYDRDILLGVEGAYFLTDSHWTEAGALAYVRAAASHFGDHRMVQRLDAAQGEEVVVEHRGDLGGKLGWPPEPHRVRKIKERTGKAVFASKLAGQGHIRFYESSASENAGRRALVLHDSFVTPISRFIAECYEHTLFVLIPDLDIGLLARFDPQILWFFQAERFLPRAARNDISLVAWVEQQERRKGMPTEGASFLAQTLFA